MGFGILMVVGGLYNKGGDPLNSSFSLFQMFCQSQAGMDTGRGQWGPSPLGPKKKKKKKFSKLKFKKKKYRLSF